MNLVRGRESGCGPLVDSGCLSVADLAGVAAGRFLTGGTFGGGPEGGIPLLSNGSRKRFCSS